MQRRHSKPRSPVTVARESLASDVYAWFLRGGGKLYNSDGAVSNKGLARRTQDSCAKLQVERKLERERKRKGE